MTIQAYDSLVPDQVAEETLVISVDNAAPVLVPNSYTLQVGEFEALGVIYSINATDADGDDVTYTLMPSGSVGNFFWINPSTGDVMLQRSLTTISTNQFLVRLPNFNYLP